MVSKIIKGIFLMSLCYLMIDCSNCQRKLSNSDVKFLYHDTIDVKNQDCKDININYILGVDNICLDDTIQYKLFLESYYKHIIDTTKNYHFTLYFLKYSENVQKNAVNMRFYNGVEFDEIFENDKIYMQQWDCNKKLDGYSWYVPELVHLNKSLDKLLEEKFYKSNK